MNQLMNSVRPAAGSTLPAGMQAQQQVSVGRGSAWSALKLRTTGALRAGVGAMLLTGLACSVALPAAAAEAETATGCLSTKPLRGVNLAGAEFNGAKLPGKVFTDYTYPSEATINYFADLGANMIRLPFRWERLQRTAGGSFDAAEQKLIQQVLTSAKKRNMCVLLDLHNYGAYGGKPLGQVGARSADFTDFWLKMSVAFPDVQTAAFGLMNEPALVSLKQWNVSGKAAFNGLRAKKDRHLLVIAGGTFSGAHDWFTLREGVSNATIFASLSDPINRSLIEVHQYVDSNFSGTKADCISPAKITAVLDKVKAWAVTNKKRVFMGEFGVADSAACLPSLQAALDAMRDEPWGGWTYWSAGAWWGKTYIFNVHPITGVTHGQLAPLQKEWTAK